MFQQQLSILPRAETRVLPPQAANLCAGVAPWCPFQTPASECLHWHPGNGPADQPGVAEAAILFTDMRGFTHHAESLDPEVVFGALNESLTLQMAAINAHGGEVNKLLGDGLVAFFSGRERIHAALRAAQELRDLVAATGPVAGVAALPIGIAVHSGRVMFGVIGTEAHAEVTVVGDVVNVTARLCGAARPFQVIVSGTVVAQVAGSQEFRFGDLGPVTLRGKAEPTAIAELLPAARAP